MNASRDREAGEGGGQGAPGVDVIGRPAFDRCYVPERTVTVVHGENCDCDLRRDAAEVAESIAVWGLLLGCAVTMAIAIVQAAIRGWQ